MLTLLSLATRPVVPLSNVETKVLIQINEVSLIQGCPLREVLQDTNSTPCTHSHTLLSPYTYSPLHILTHTHNTHCTTTHTVPQHTPIPPSHPHTTHTHALPPSTQTVAANMSGELHLRMEAEVVTATTYFKDLQNHQFGTLILQYKGLKLHPKMQIKGFHINTIHIS